MARDLTLRKIAVALATVVLLAAGAAGAAAADDAGDIFGDTYTADLTGGQGDFRVGDAGTYATSYASDGLHVLVRKPSTWGPTGVQASLPHSVLSVEIETTTIAAPPDASFGPFCWKDPTHGYGFVVSGTGRAQLVQVRGSYARVKVLKSVRTAPTDAGTAVKLMITCTRTEPLGPADVRLGGYVNGTKKVVATAPAVSEFQYTGFSGRTTTAAPGEWTVAKFWRRGPADMPKDMPK